MSKLNINNMTILITGSSGFIGYHISKRLLDNNIKVIGIDNMNDYYDIKLKEYRLSLLNNYDNFIFINEDISNKDGLTNIFNKYKPDIVINLAAQVGVRYSLDNSDKYIISNIVGFYNIIECIKEYPVKHFLFASSSSVYGMNNNLPYSEDDNVDQPASLYGATKRSNELFAYNYAKVYNIPTTGLRFFSVYGPLGRPDMAYFDFTNKMINGDTIDLYNYGNCKRDYTYIDDIVESIYRIMQVPPKSDIPYDIYNIGNSNPIEINHLIVLLKDLLIEHELLDESYDLDSHINLMEMQKGDVLSTYSNSNKLDNKIGFKPNTPINEGLNKFIEWYKDYYKNN